MSGHRPLLFFAGRWGSWAYCPCGWASLFSYTTLTGAHIAFGMHLIGRPEPANPAGLRSGRR